MKRQARSASPLKSERIQLILETIRDAGRMTVSDLSGQFNVSAVTIRRDIKVLADQGLLRREHGGLVYPVASPPEPLIMQRMRRHQAIKERLAQAAAELVKDGDSVFIGSGSTTTYVARYLTHRRGLTVITNAMTVATELAPAHDLTVVVLGGVLRREELSMIGHITEQALREVRVDKVIIGIPAISVREGLTNDYLPEVMTDRAIIEMASRLIVVADHSKFGRVASAYIAPLNCITTLVTDEQTDAAMLDRIREQDIELIVV